MNKPLVVIENLKKIYHTPKSETVAVEGFNLEINDGEFISIVGPSGCGKSTILSILAGLVEPSEGKITYSEENICVGYMLQHDCLFEWLNIIDNVLLGLKVRGELNARSEGYAKRLLETYGLGEFMYSYPRELSGGMRQRAALIRTLAIKPNLLLLDESFSALDPVTRISVSEDICRIIKRQGVTAVLITHDLQEAICMSDRVILCSDRPAKVKNIYNIDFAGIEDFAGKRIAKEFSVYYESLYKELYDE